MSINDENEISFDETDLLREKLGLKLLKDEAAGGNDGNLNTQCN